LIGSLTGKLLEKSPSGVLLEVGGVGYRLSVPLTTYGRLSGAGATVTLSIHTHVREDSIALYGFDTRRERDLFEKLIAVPGIGPRLGLALLSHLEPPELVEAARTRNTDILSRVPGVGPRTAERLAVELAGVMERTPGLISPAEDAGGTPGLRADLLSALENLGYRSAQAGRVVDKVLTQFGAGETPVASLIREALRHLGPGGRLAPAADLPGGKGQPGGRRRRCEGGVA
jgi:Holliday junction DNA helicase RuvA